MNVAKALIKILVVCLCLVMAGAAAAEETKVKKEAEATEAAKPAEEAKAEEDSEPTFDELGLNFIRHDTVDDDEQKLDGYGFILHLGSSIAKSEDVDLYLRLELSVMNFSGSDDEGNSTDGREIGLSPGLRLFVFKGHILQPYFEFGFGVVHNSTEIRGQGTEVNFLSYGGLGLRAYLGDAFSVDAGYRIRHISNGGLDDQNSGLNSHMYMLALNFPF